MTEIRLKVQVQMTMTMTEAKVKDTMLTTGTSLDDRQHPSSWQQLEGVPEVRAKRCLNRMR